MRQAEWTLVDFAQRLEALTRRQALRGIRLFVPIAAGRVGW
jgi:hypothetical protein